MRGHLLNFVARTKGPHQTFGQLPQRGSDAVRASENLIIEGGAGFVASPLGKLPEGLMGSLSDTFSHVNLS